MITEISILDKLPPIRKKTKHSASPELVQKIKRIHENHENDWKKLEERIKIRHTTVKNYQDTNFMRVMWAFKDSSKEYLQDIQDTSSFRLRKEATRKKIYLQRLETLFSPDNKHVGHLYKHAKRASVS